MIKNYFRNMTLSGVFTWLLLGLVAFLIIKDCNREAEHKRDLQNAMNDKNKTTPTSLEAEKIAEEANEKGDTVVIFEKADPIIKTLELKVEDQRKVDSLARINNIKEGKIQQLSVIVAEANAKNIRLTQQLANNGKDTMWVFKDKYLTNTIYRKDTAFMSDIWLDATVSKIDYSEKKNWFSGANSNMAKVWFNSPYIKPMGLDNLEIVQKEKFFDWGVDVEGRFMHTDKQLLIGPKANIKLGRFNIVGGYGLNTGTGKGQVWYGGEWRVR